MEAQNKSSFFQSSHDTYNQSINLVSIEQQIAYMVKFYPSPKFIEMEFTQTEASSNITPNSPESQIDLAQYSSLSRHPSNLSKQSANSSKNELSQIKVRHFGIAFNSHKSKQKDSKSLNESQLDCKSLLDELSFHQKPQRSFCLNSQQNHNFLLDCQLEHKEKYFLAQEIPKFGEGKNIEENLNQNISKEEKIHDTKRYIKRYQLYRWDPPSQIAFQKELKIKRLGYLVTNHHVQNLRIAFQKIKIKSQTMICENCKKVFRDYRRKKTCRKCQIKATRLFKFEQKTSYLGFQIR